MLLDPHVGTIIWTIVTFLVVLVVLRATVWRPLLGALDERERRISDALEEAERARKEAQLLIDEHQQKLQSADADAREIVRLAREAAEKVEQEIVSSARQEAQRTTEQARRAIENEKQAAIAENAKMVVPSVDMMRMTAHAAPPPSPMMKPHFRSSLSASRPAGIEAIAAAIPRTASLKPTNFRSNPICSR